MKQKCESIIKEQLQEIRCEHGMKEYLTMLARFPQMGYENVLLLMYLFPEATMVCGKGAWKNYQADIKVGERAIPLLCPLGAVGDSEVCSFMAQVNTSPPANLTSLALCANFTA